ncbi:MAG: DUF2589 domain-containing protein [Lachnospiraceae bacterium]|nr:DUF2589 domain-containing protein [Lachnospiraceae bacterium]
MAVNLEKDNATGMHDNKGKATDKQETKHYKTDEITNDTSQFFPLNDLVYAPLKAVALSNMNLSISLIDNLKSLGTVKHTGNEEVLFLKNLNIEYDKLHPSENNDTYIEKVEMQVPLLSLIQIPSLNIKNAEVDFQTEVAVLEDKQNKKSIVGRICSPQTRKTDELPKIEYKIKLKSASVTEGYMRITDALDSSPVSKKLGASPLTSSRDIPEALQTSFDQKRNLQKQADILHGLYNDISEFIKENETANNSFFTDNKEFNKQKYENMKQDILTKILKIKEALLDNEIAELEERGICIAEQ